MLMLTGYLMLKNYFARGKGLEEEWEFGTEHDQFKMSWVFCETLGWLFGYVS